jgi:hypothetical protein
MDDHTREKHREWRDTVLPVEETARSKRLTM